MSGCPRKHIGHEAESMMLDIHGFLIFGLELNFIVLDCSRSSSRYECLYLWRRTTPVLIVNLFEGNKKSRGLDIVKPPNYPELLLVLYMLNLLRI